MKNLLDKVELINEEIESINESIGNLLLEQSFNPWQYILRRFIIDKVFSDDDKKDVLDDKADKEAKKKAEEELKKSYDEWKDSEKKQEDIEELVDEISDVSQNDNKEDIKKLEELLNQIADLQKSMLLKTLNKQSFNKVTLKLPQPLKFKLVRGKEKGKELTIEKTKTYDVFLVEEKGSYTKIYFNMKTKSMNWLRDYSILLVIKIKSLKSGEQYGGTTISLAYVNEDLVRDREIKIIDEKVLTHKGMVEVKSFK